MKIMDQQAAQGDVLFTRMTTLLPSDIVKSEPEADGNHIVTHSETGHHHVMVAEDVDMFEAANDPFVGYLVVNKTTVLRHLREDHTHEEIQFPPGVYRFNKQREMREEQVMAAQD